MKYKARLFIITALAVCVSVQTSTASVPLPEFKSKEDLRQRVQERMLLSTTKKETPVFYTGKPFETELQGYLFKYRNYDPRMSRWTSIDPSGFPDGPNAYKYGNSPVGGFDPDGLTWAEAGAMFWDWVTGTGPSQRNFAEGSDWVEDLKSAPGVNKARTAFNDKNQGAAPPDYVALTNYAASFGLSGLFAAGGNSTEQFIGSYRVDISPTQEDSKTYAQYTVTNTTSATSFFYGAAPSWDRDQFGPGGNMTQTYTWKELIE